VRPEPARASPLRATALALLLCAAAVGPSHAEEEDRLLSSFARPATARPRSQAVQQAEWDRRLPIATCFDLDKTGRDSGCFGPPVLRAGDAAILAAARASRWTEVLELLKSGRAGANAQDDIQGNALVLAARAGREDVLRELLRRGANTERLGEGGFTALGAAAFAGQRGVVRLLLRAGADSERWGATGQTALHLASIAGRTEVLHMLLAKVDVDMLNSRHETALDVAAAAGQQDAMDVLIKAGADLQHAGQR
jgi:hypothetical protein